MDTSARVKVAALATTVTLGGLAGAGIAVRNGDQPTAAMSAQKLHPKVIHRRKVKHVPAKRPKATASPPSQATPVSDPPAAPAPAPAVVAPSTEPAVVSAPAPARA